MYDITHISQAMKFDCSIFKLKTHQKNWRQLCNNFDMIIIQSKNHMTYKTKYKKLSCLGQKYENTYAYIFDRMMILPNYLIQ